MTAAPARITVPCQVCLGQEFETVYEREFVSAALGRWKTRLALCEHCGFLFANPRPSRAAMDAHYRGSQHASGAVYRDLEPGSRQDGLDRTRHAFLRRFVGEARGSVLDVGCSTGHFLAGLGLDGWERVGIEPSAQAAAAARAHGFEVVEGTLEEHGLAPERFHLITMVSVLEHLWDVNEGIASVARLLAPGGRLFLDVPHSLEPEAMISEYFAFEHLSHFTPASLRYLLARHGLEVEGCEPRASSGLLVMARRAAEVPLPSDAELRGTRRTLGETVARYRAERQVLEDDLHARFEPEIRAWKAAGMRVALYGAGEHSHFLLDLIDFGDCLTAVLDSDPGKRGTSFRRWPVHGPADLPDLELDAIVISSRPFQEEIAASLAPLVRAGKPELVRCYPGLAAPCAAGR